MDLGTLVLGLINGSVIGLLAAGFVLVYTSNRFLNLAHAQLGAVSAGLLAKLVNDLGWSFWPALLVVLPLAAGTGIAVERLLVAPVRRRTSSQVRLLLLSIGVSQLLLALSYVPFLAPDEESGKGFPQPFASDLEVGGVVLTGMSVLTVLVVPVLLGGLVLFLERSRLGKQVRAAAGNPQAATLCGISTERVSLLTWGLAGLLSGVSAVLSGPATASFELAAVGPTLLVQTLGAAAFGAFVSLGWAVGGGLALGVVYQLVLGATRDAGDAQLAIFAVVLAVVLLRGRAIGKVFSVTGAPVPERPGVRVPPVLRDRPFYRSYRSLLAGAGLLVAVLAPLLPGLRDDDDRFLLVLVLVYALIGVALTVLTGWAGQVSLGHFAVVGLGAFLTARWSEQGWTVLGMVLVVGLVGALTMAVVGSPALRVPGLTLVVTTVGFAVVVPSWLLLQPRIGGDSPFTTLVPAPSLGPGLGTLSGQRQLYYLVLLALVLVLLGFSSLRRTHAGRAVLAVRDNERAVAALGVTPATVKLTALALSGAVAGVAGVFWAIAWQRVSPTQFGPEVSTAVLAVPIIGGLGSLAGAVAAAVLLYVPTLFLAPLLTPLLGDFGRSQGFLLLLAGAGVVVTMLQFPNGIAGLVEAKWQALLNRRAAEALEQAAPDDALPLAVRDVRLGFGGIRALDGVELEVRPGEIVGLIGPNGAGKTTLMHVVSGVLRPESGSVRLFGREVVDLPPAVRPAYGLGRTFQDASLFAGLTVSETLQLAVARGTKTGVLGALTQAPWVRSAEADVRSRAQQVLEAFNLQPWADSLTAELSTGTRRICDLAVQVAARPKVLLLDEPTAGVAQRDAEAFGPLVRRIRDELGCAVLLIEHDMPLLMGLCDRVYAMEAGRVIAEGTPEEVRSDPRVVASYLGSDPTAIDRSGDGSPPPGPPSAAPRPPAQRRTPPAAATERLEPVPRRARASRAIDVAAADVPAPDVEPAPRRRPARGSAVPRRST